MENLAWRETSFNGGMFNPETLEASELPAGQRWWRGKIENTDKQIELFLENKGEFTEYGGEIKLRRYQSKVAERICASVLDQKGLSFVVMFPRQSGKNELQAQIEGLRSTGLDGDKSTWSTSDRRLE
jgi:hypothetical protein